MSVGPESEETRLKKKRNAQEMGKVDPMFWRNKGKLGGSVKGIEKGFSKMSPERRSEIARAAGIESQRKQKEKREISLK
jgi:hypothetical protein